MPLEWPHGVLLYHRAAIFAAATVPAGRVRRPIAELRRLESRYNLAVLDLSHISAETAPETDGWARLISRLLAAGHVGLLSTELSKTAFFPDPRRSARAGATARGEFGKHFARRPGPPHRNYRHAGREVRLPGCGTHHAPHPVMQGSRPAPAADRVWKDRRKRSIRFAEVLEKLEQLDDVVFEAISGSETALASLGCCGREPATSWARISWPNHASNTCVTPSPSGTNTPAQAKSAMPPGPSRPWTCSACYSTARDPSGALGALSVMLGAGCHAHASWAARRHLTSGHACWLAALA